MTRRVLVGPTGRKFIVTSMRDERLGRRTITLDDTAATSLADAGSNGTGTYKPGNFRHGTRPVPAQPRRTLPVTRTGR